MSKPHTSPGLWALAWRRLRGDKIAMVSLAVVGAFFLLVLASASGLLASNWEDEVAVSYAPPTFVGADKDVAVDGAIPLADERSTPTPVNVLDPLADDIAELRAQLKSDPAAGVDMYGVTDPLADDVAALRAGMGKTKKLVTHKAATLPFGADKWGHDIIQKTIKGGETSIVVGLVAALLAVVLGTVFGAVSGYFGGVVDDFFNWFYSIFTSIPSILMILTVAAVLQQKGVLTIVLILGLTGWTGPYRLIRAEYIKHKAREYVMAADANGASHWR